MNSPAFDTHHAVKMLEKAGAEEPLAEAVVATIGVAVTASVASKADVKELGRELSGRMDGLDGRIDGVERGMGGLRKDLTGRMDATKRELLEEMNEVKRDLSGRMDGFERDMGDIRKEMKILEHRITIRLGLMMLGGFSILAVLIKL